LPSSFNVILSSAWVCSTCPPVSVSGTVFTRGLFPGTAPPPLQSSKEERLKRSVTTRWPTNINVVPIDYAFRPRLRSRLTLRRLTLRRNPWTFGDTVFHSVCRYSCQHSHFRRLQEPSRVSLHKPTERSATVSENRGQTTDHRGSLVLQPLMTSPRGFAASLRPPDIRLATLATLARRDSQGPAHSAPTPASRRPIRPPSTESA
jgi:hypothetical protein